MLRLKIANKNLAMMLARNRCGVKSAENNNMSNVAPSAAGDDKSTVSNDKSNITMNEYAVRRLGELKSKPQATVTQKQEIVEEPTNKAEPEEQVDTETPDAQEGGEPQESTNTKGKDVLSQLDLTELSDDDIAELAQKGKSGLLKRIAELTAKRKMAEERMAQMETYFQQQSNKNALEPKVENNPYEHIKTADELSKQSEQVNEVIEWAEDVLDKAETIGYEDVAATVDGKELTKAEVKDHLRRARKARDKYLPAQQKELNAKEQRKSLRSAFENQATKELNWLSAQEDSDIRRQYQAMMSDPRLKNIEDVMPEIAPQLPYLLAHAANSLYGRKLISLDKPSLKVNPSGSPDLYAASSERPAVKGEKAVKDARTRLLDSGSIGDYIAFRTLQKSKRK